MCRVFLFVVVLLCLGCEHQVAKPSKPIRVELQTLRTNPEILSALVGKEICLEAEIRFEREVTTQCSRPEGLEIYYYNVTQYFYSLDSLEVVFSHPVDGGGVKSFSGTLIQSSEDPKATSKFIVVNAKLSDESVVAESEVEKLKKEIERLNIENENLKKNPEKTSEQTDNNLQGSSEPKSEESEDDSDLMLYLIWSSAVGGGLF